MCSPPNQLSSPTTTYRTTAAPRWMSPDASRSTPAGVLLLRYRRNCATVRDRMNRTPSTTAGKPTPGTPTAGKPTTGTPSTQPPAGPMNIRRSIGIVGAALLMAGAVFWVYLPAADGPFIYDDVLTVIENPSIHQLWPPFGEGDRYGPLNPMPGTPVSARPLVSLSLAVNYHFHALDPTGYRIVHLVVHLISAILLWAVVTMTLKLEHFCGRFDRTALPLGFFSAFAWALHPVNTETIVYVTQRTELMMGMFYLATLFFSIRYFQSTRTTARTTYVCLASLSCCCGMLCKEVMASAAAMVFIYEFIFIGGTFRQIFKRSWPLYAGLSLGWLTVLCIYLFGSPTPGGGFAAGISPLHWWLTQTKVIFLYLKLAIWPWPLVIHYEVPALKSLQAAWPWVFGTAALICATLWMLWRRRSVGFVAIWFFAVLSPTLLIPLPGEAAVERRMYVPLAAIVPLLVVGGYSMLNRLHRRFTKTDPRDSVAASWTASVPLTACVTVATAVTILFGFLCSRRLIVFGDEFTLWQDAKVHQPHDPIVWINLGTELAKQNRLPDAASHFEQAVRLDPASHKGHYNLARALESDQPIKAIAHYRTALSIHPNDAATHYNLARVSEEQFLEQDAITHYRQAIAIRPEFSAARTNLGLLLLDLGETNEAIEQLEAAARLQEDLPNTMNLILAYSRSGQTENAISTLEKALNLAMDAGDQALANRLQVALKQLREQSRP